MARRALVHRRLLPCATLAALVVGAVPSSAAATDATEVLPGPAVAAGAADLDGDGAREIVRLVAGPSESTVVDAWRDAGGRWERIGSAQLVVPDEIGNAALSDRTLRAGALLVTRRDGEDRVLAITAEAVPDDAFGRTCCLALAEIAVGGETGLLLRPLSANGLDRSANVVHAVDLDGDETDELVTVTSEPGSSGDVRATRVGVMAWGTGGFAGVGTAETSGGLYGLYRGETNGIVGDDLVGTTDEGTIARVAVIDGSRPRGWLGWWRSRMRPSSQTPRATKRWPSSSGDGWSTSGTATVAVSWRDRAASTSSSVRLRGRSSCRADAAALRPTWVTPRSR